jgi:hypothetical protein
MIKRKRINIVLDIEEGSEEFVEQSIIDGMEFTENEGIVSVNISDEEELSDEELDKQFYAATTIVASLLEGNLQNEDALVRRAYRIASILIKQQQ